MVHEFLLDIISYQIQFLLNMWLVSVTEFHNIDLPWIIICLLPNKSSVCICIQMEFVPQMALTVCLFLLFQSDL